MKKLFYASLFLAVSVSALSKVSFADVKATGDEYPMSQTFNHVSGFAWVTANNTARSYRYPIFPGPGHYCELEMAFMTANARPYNRNGETFMHLAVTYFDPALMENDGQVTSFINLNWSPTAERPTPFYPGSNWKSSLGDGKILANVSYDTGANTTIIEFESRFMIFQKTWATIVTTPDHKQIKSIRISHDWGRRVDRPEEERLHAFECTNP